MSETDPRVAAIRGAVDEIEQSAVVIGRTVPRDATVMREVMDIMESTKIISRVVGETPTTEPPPPTRPPPVEPPPTRPPPVEPPPATGAWVNPAETGITSAAHTPLTSQYGWSLCDAKNLHHYTAYDNAVLNTQYQGCGSKALALTDTWVQGLKNPTTGAITNKWCVRAFDVGAVPALIDHCTFSDSKVEHGNYFNVLGGIEWNRCKFTRNGSQGIQIVYATPGSKRQHETRFWNPADPAGSKAAWEAHIASTKTQLHRIIECSFEQVGIPKNSIGLHPGERPAFCVSMFEGGPHGVRIERCYIKTDIPWIDDNGVARTCFGAIMAHDRASFEMYDTYIYYRNGPMDVVQLWNCGNVALRGGEIWATNRVDIRPKSGQRIQITGVKGDAPVMISTNPWYSWETSPNWDWSKVLYQGPITKDLDFVCP
jgi:hypothetical protein